MLKMFSEDILARLSELNQQRLPLVSLQMARSTVSAEEECAAPSLSCAEAGDEDLSQLPAGIELHNAWGTHWQRERSLRDIWPHGDHWLSHQFVRLDQSRCAAVTRSRELRALWDGLPDHVVYLDLETCGFAGSMIFLIGLIHRRDDALLLSQLLARNYAEEKAMLQTLWTILAGKRVLATFNGKSFDWPMVHDRSTLHHLGYDTRPHDSEYRTAEPFADGLPALTRDHPRPELIQCDLLHHARRRWKNQLPDCKLQTLERLICRRRRSDDIPGREIPSAYHDFVRSGDAWLIRSVLHHNALDLVTLLQLSMTVLQ